MAQLFILLVSLCLIGLVAALVYRRRKPVPPLPQVEPLPPQRLASRLRVVALGLPWQRRRALPHRIPALGLMERLLRKRCDLPALHSLQENGRAWLMALLSLKQALRRGPRLPAPALGQPRMLQLCQRYLLSGGSTRAEDLLTAVKTIQQSCPLTLCERLHLPLCLQVALAQQLSAVLENLSLCVKETRQGEQLGKRLCHARKPMQLLRGWRLSLAQTEGMVAFLTQRQETALLSGISQRMGQEHFSLQELSEQHARQQTLLADQLRSILSAFQALDKMDWAALLEPEDPLHQLLLNDPAGTYPRMDAPTRSLYRQRIAVLAQVFHVDELHLAEEALSLCAMADPNGLQDHVGWYLLEKPGILALQTQLRTRRGRVAIELRHAAPWLCRLALALAALAGGLEFLNARHPLWMLPVFLGVWSCLTHAVMDALSKPRPIPRMHMTHIAENARVLIVLPAVLQNSTQAVAAARQLLLARKAFPAGAVDCLLLGDYADCMTQTSSDDESLVEAARMTMDALDGDGGRFLYLQRRRSWSGDQHAYMGRERTHGALESLNQLIVRGECADAFDAATLPPSAFHQHYAYVLALEENVLPAVDTLLPLLGALTHPLNERRPTAEGTRGVSVLLPRVKPLTPASRIGHWAGAARGGCLYRPHALLESTEGWLSSGNTLMHRWLEQHLSGCVQDSSQLFFAEPPTSLAAWLEQRTRQVRGSWQLLPWLLPHIKTPGGLRRNPLSSFSRYALRQQLRQSLAPICRLLLLLYAVLCRSLPLGLLALLAPALPVTSPSRFLARLVELPLTAAVSVNAIGRALWRSFITHERLLDRQSSFASNLSGWENWSQTLAVIGFAAASLAVQPISLPGLLLAAAFACFPLVHPWLDAPLHPTPIPTRDMETSLMEVARATWQFFAETVTEDTHHLPPESLQLKPWRGTAKRTTPGSIGLYLLSCLAVRELGIISTEKLCQLVSCTMDSLTRLPLWHGLPYASYGTDTLSAEAPYVSSLECGLLCACLITLAQGLRSYLPQIPDEHTALPQQVDDFAASIELSRLFDRQAQLFFTGYNVRLDAPDAAHHSLYASAARLLSFVAVMRREVTAKHLAHLNRTRVRIGRNTPQVSQQGTASEYLLPEIFLPNNNDSLQAIIHAQRKRSVDGMFGVSESGYWGFDPLLNYRSAAFGLPEAALDVAAFHPVIAPYAAALCLPFAPDAAFESLMRLRSRGMLGRLGYFDSLDLDSAHLPEDTEEAAIQCHVAQHQGMLLCALCNLLTGNVLASHFSAVPAAAVTLPLLSEEPHPPITLPARLLHPESLTPKEPPFRRSAAALAAPMDAHLIGSPEAMLLMSAQGIGTMRSHGVPLTVFTGDPTQLEGVQFFLHDGLTDYRLADPYLSGDTVFSEGALRFIRTCGQVQTTLTALTDPVQGAFLHIIEVANLTDRERHVELRSHLVPDPGAEPCSLSTDQPEERVLTITHQPAKGATLTLCHAISTHEPLLKLTADASGTGAGFCARLRIGARGRGAVIFITRLLGAGEPFSLQSLAPRLSDMNSLLNLSRLMSRTMTDSLRLTQDRAAELSRLFGALLWRDQPRQGAVSPLTYSPARMKDLGIDLAAPLLTVMVHSAGCASLVQDASDTIAWLALMGQPAQLCVLCQGSQATEARSKAAETLLNRSGTVLLSADLEEGARETIEAASRVILYEGSGSIAAQMEALTQPLPPPIRQGTPDAPPLAEEELLLPAAWGGFQPDTGDMVLRLQPGDAPPAMVWMLHSGQLSSQCYAAGLGETCGAINLTQEETAYLSGECGIFTPTPLPLGQGLSTRVQASPGAVCWHSLGYGLDMTLITAVIPETAFACRSLRLKNMTQREQTLTLTIAVRFALGDAAFTCLTPMAGCVVAAAPGAPVHGCVALVEGSCETRTVSPLAFHGFGAIPDLDTPADEAGTLALLTLPVTIPAGGSQSVSWLVGACGQMDDMELLLARLRETGTSIIYREARKLWADRLGRLTIHTPDERLDLMMNHLLPWRARCQYLPGRRTGFAAALQSTAALMHTEPESARALLLHCARHQYAEGDVQRWWQGTQTGLRTKGDDGRLFLPLAACWYIQCTGDEGILQEQLPWLLGEEVPAGQEDICHTPPTTREQDSLFTHCLRALTSIRLGRHDLPLAADGESVTLGMMYAWALHCFAPYAGAARGELEDMRTRLLSAIDLHGWDGSWYGNHKPECLCQSLSVLALGCSQRTALAMEEALRQPPAAIPWMLLALRELGWTEQAWGLVQQTDMVSADDSMLYHVILQKLLGFEKRGHQVRLRPMVPPDWDSFTLTLQWGASTWHFQASQEEPLLTCDGERAAAGWITLADDGQIHQVRTPLRRGG